MLMFGTAKLLDDSRRIEARGVRKKLNERGKQSHSRQLQTLIGGQIGYLSGQARVLNQ